MGAPAAQESALRQLSSVPGVVGSMVFGPSGDVAASSFPEVFDVTGLQQLASQLAGDAWFRDWLADDRASLDLRYGDGRAVVRALRGSWLLVLCTADVNSALVAMSLTQALRRLRAPSADGAAAAASTGFAEEPSALERLRAVASAELGEHAGQAMEILAAAGEGPGDLARAVSEIEKMTRLFISRKKAEEIGRSMRDVLGT